MVEKFGVLPESIPDYLALVGDSAGGIPDLSSEWDVDVRGARSLAAGLAEHREEAELYKDLATLRLDVPLTESLADLRWDGVRRQDFQALCGELGFARLMELPHKWADG